MRVIIAGSRKFHNLEFLTKKMDALLANQTEVTIISGTAMGADKTGEEYAALRKFPVERYPANWDKYGKAAGPIRNEEMAKVADAAVIFWDGKSPGSKNMIATAEKYNLLTRVIRY